MVTRELGGRERRDGFDGLPIIELGPLDDTAAALSRPISTTRIPATLRLTTRTLADPIRASTDDLKHP